MIRWQPTGSTIHQSSEKSNKGNCSVADSIESAASCLKAKELKEQIVQLDVADSSLVVFKDDTDRLAADTRVLRFFAGKVLTKRETEEEPLRADLKKL